jgi:hypothetical protein
MLIQKFHLSLSLFSPHFFPVQTPLQLLIVLQCHLDALKELDNMTKTLQKIAGNRDDNKKILEQKKSLIIKQISAVKSKLLNVSMLKFLISSNSMSISLIADVMS